MITGKTKTRILTAVIMVSILVAFCFAGEIHHLAKIGDAKKMKNLLEQSPWLVNSKDAYGWTPLCEAVFCKKKAMADFLISKGAHVNARTRCGSSPLEIAVNFRYNEIAQTLKKNGASLE